MPSVATSSFRIAGSRIEALDPPVPTSNRPLPSSCEHRFHNLPCDARAWFPPVFSGGDLLQFTLLLHVYTDNGNALGKNNSGFRQRRLVNLIRGVLPPLIERLCFS